jgi:hypothetical protein
MQSDVELTKYVQEMYGQKMAKNFYEMCRLDPDNQTGFMQHVRKSLSLEMKKKAESETWPTS